MANREQRSNREKRKQKAEKPAKIPLANVSKTSVGGSDRKPGAKPKR
jgi:hypothetical protein